LALPWLQTLDDRQSDQQAIHHRHPVYAIGQIQEMCLVVHGSGEPLALLLLPATHQALGDLEPERLRMLDPAPEQPSPADDERGVLDDVLGICLPASLSKQVATQRPAVSTVEVPNFLIELMPREFHQERWTGSWKLEFAAPQTSDERLPLAQGEQDHRGPHVLGVTNQYMALEEGHLHAGV
jgi:hypothetical protein